MKKLLLPSLLAAGLLAGCGDNEIDEGGNSFQRDATLQVKAYVTSELQDFHAAAKALQAAAPDADEDGWNAQDDAAAVAAMKAEWKKARVAYERIEGAIAVIFPDLDVSTDERYDGFIAEEADDFLFDGEGVTGVHAIERILWADQHTQLVIDFESSFPHYVPAAFPANFEEARAFKEGLVQRLVDDTKAMLDGFVNKALAPEAAFRGVIGSLEEQLEKVLVAEQGEDESRYARYTLADMRANLEGGRAIYEAFRPWVRSVTGGDELDADIEAGFNRLGVAYAGIQGDALPAVPEGWSAANPDPAHLENTAYGKLFGLLADETDPQRSSSLVHAMLSAADALAIPELPEED